METQTQFFCYVYDAPERTPQMFPLEADTFADAVHETRRVMRDEGEAGAFAEIWDSWAGDQVMTRIEAPPAKGGLLRVLRRNRPSSGSSRP
ncbi:hypothetical protein [Brevundimonas diminuta]|uniref:hypothetical protein n=1 Tax=Brevundimonas diminuta TaxID=293 RepID=UPI0032093D54